MKIDLTKLFNGSGNSVSVDYNLNLSDLVYGTYNPIQNGVLIKGEIYEKADVVHLDVSVSFQFDGVCDRCAEDITRDMTFKLDKIIVQNLTNDVDYDNYIVAEKGILDLDELIREEIQLFLPSKMLCNSDCKGLCFKCGKNLNYGKCSCKKDADPRMEALLQLLDEE